MTVQTALKNLKTVQGLSIKELSKEKYVLLIFLRHFGCTFCREAISDIAEKMPEFKKANVEVVFVHMTDQKIAEKYYTKYQLNDVKSVSDPKCEFYKAFGLVKGNFNQLFGLKSWVRGFEAGVLDGHLVGYWPLGDGFQMPGAFVLKEGEIKAKFIHKLANERPDYWQLLASCEFKT